MKILLVCRWHGNHAAAFIMEQVEALQALGHEVKYCTARKGGLMGYVDLFRNIRREVRSWHPDVIHAHYGICGLVACFASRLSVVGCRSSVFSIQKSEIINQQPELKTDSAKRGLKTENHKHIVPVVTTYPGSDINDPKVRPISRLSMRMSAYNLFMSKRQIAKVQDLATPNKTQILRYGINLDLFQSMDKMQARRLFRAAKPEEATWSDDDKLVLFSSKFTRLGKDPELAQAVISQANQTLNAQRSSLNVYLLPLTGGYTKEEMMWLMNAVDAAIVTSKSEGSPQFTKEVMACGTPIVSVDVGDVPEQVEGLDGCYIATTREVEELSALLLQAINYGKTNGHQHIVNMGLSNLQIAEKLIDIYQKVLKK